MSAYSDYTPKFSFDTDKMAYDLAMIYANAHSNDNPDFNPIQYLLMRFVDAYTTYEQYTPEKLMSVYNEVNRVDFTYNS